MHRRSSKTDQEGAGHRIEVAYGDHLDTCPVRTYRTWIDQLDTCPVRADISEGPVFRSVNRHGTPSPTVLSDKAVALIIKKHAERIGRDPPSSPATPYDGAFQPKPPATAPPNAPSPQPPGTPAP